MTVENKPVSITPRLKERKTHPKRQMARRIMLFVSFLLFPITVFYLSPVLSIWGPVMGIISGSLIIFGALFVFSLFMGRIFCSYLCPMGGMQTAISSIQNKRIKLKSAFVKWIIFIPWLATIIALPIIINNPFVGFNFIYRTGNASIGLPGVSIVTLPGFIIYYGVVAIVFLLGLIVGKRSFCHHMCWISPFMIIGRKLSNWLRIPSLRLKTENEKCISCKRCDRSCPMSINVQELVKKGDMETSHCILCGNCIDACPKNVIQYIFTSYPKAKSLQIVVEND